MGAYVSQTIDVKRLPTRGTWKKLFFLHLCTEQRDRAGTQSLHGKRKISQSGKPCQSFTDYAQRPYIERCIVFGHRMAANTRITQCTNQIDTGVIQTVTRFYYLVDMRCRP